MKRLDALYILVIAGSSNGRTGAFEASNLGSIPSPAAMIREKPLVGFDAEHPCGNG